MRAALALARTAARYDRTLRKSDREIFGRVERSTERMAADGCVNPGCPLRPRAKSGWPAAGRTILGAGRAKSGLAKLRCAAPGGGPLGLTTLGRAKFLGACGAGRAMAGGAGRGAAARGGGAGRAAGAAAGAPPFFCGGAASAMPAQDIATIETSATVRTNADMTASRRVVRAQQISTASVIYRSAHERRLNAALYQRSSRDAASRQQRHD